MKITCTMHESIIFMLYFKKKNISPISEHVYLKSFLIKFVKAIGNITPKRERERGGYHKVYFLK